MEKMSSTPSLFTHNFNHWHTFNPLGIVGWLFVYTFANKLYRGASCFFNHSLFSASLLHTCWKLHLKKSI